MGHLLHLPNVARTASLRLHAFFARIGRRLTNTKDQRTKEPGVWVGDGYLTESADEAASRRTPRTSLWPRPPLSWGGGGNASV